MSKMKKIFTIILVALMCCVLMTLAACPNGNQGDGGEDGVYSMKVTVGNKEFTATLYNTEAAQAFAKMLPLTVDMSELNGNEKYFYLDTSLPTKIEGVGKINAGDIMLWGADCLVLFYKSFNTPYSYTKLGKLDDVTGLAAALGSGGVTVTFSR